MEFADRVYRKVKAPVGSLHLFGSIDKLYLPALVGAEVLARRLQANVDAYANSNKPNWEEAKLWSVEKESDDLCDEAFELYATKKRKEELELLQAQNKVMGLLGPPWSSKEYAPQGGKDGENGAKCRSKGKPAGGDGAEER